MKNIGALVLCAIFLGGCAENAEKEMEVKVFQTSAEGDKMTEIAPSEAAEYPMVELKPEEKFQTILGFGGAFTESSAHLLNQMSAAKRNEIINAYFGTSGADYTLCRTHMNSCDFSLDHYSYASVPGDTNLEHFTIEADRDDVIPMIKDAMAASNDGFKIIASPWTAPPWMKDNNNYVGGTLLPEYYPTWALFFSKYVDAYREEGIDIWGFTVENEPHGNNNNWESMHFSPQTMTDFVVNHLGPQLEADGKGDLVILGFDQNRDGVEKWADEMYKDEKTKKYYDGMAVHWYASTYEVFPEALQYAHNKAPEKYLIETEACIDAEVPHWQDDKWYWQKEATDWGWDWASEEEKYLHPKYVPVYRYARDIIGCLNNHVQGWIDWNMVLDTQGGPNWFKNWCVAPIIVKPETDEVYYTPLYYTMVHFSKFIRPGAQRIGYTCQDAELQITAAQNQDGSISVIVLNTATAPKSFNLKLGEKQVGITIAAQALQTITIN